MASIDKAATERGHQRKERAISKGSMDEPFDRDTQLMLRLQAGETACFEQLVERHKQRVFNLVFRFLGGSGEAEDIAQEIFLDIYHARTRYKPTARFTTWLYIICRNTCFKQQRKRRPVSLSVSAGAGTAENSVASRLEDHHNPSPLEAALHGERALAVRRAIDALPASQKMALILSRYEELPYKDIAAAMGCSVKAVKSLLHRAKMNVKDKLTGYLEK